MQKETLNKDIPQIINLCERDLMLLCNRMTMLAEAHMYAMQVLSRYASGEVKGPDEAIACLRATPQFFEPVGLS